jgi:hypothetical protein
MLPAAFQTVAQNGDPTGVSLGLEKMNFSDFALTLVAGTH